MFLGHGAGMEGGESMEANRASSGVTLISRKINMPKCRISVRREMSVLVANRDKNGARRAGDIKAGPMYDAPGKI